MYCGLNWICLFGCPEGDCNLVELDSKARRVELRGAYIRSTGRCILHLLRLRMLVCNRALSAAPSISQYLSGCVSVALYLPLPLYLQLYLYLLYVSITLTSIWQGPCSALLWLFASITSTANRVDSSSLSLSLCLSLSLSVCVGSAQRGASWATAASYPLDFHCVLIGFFYSSRGFN